MPRVTLTLVSALAVAGNAFGQASADEQHWLRITELRARVADPPAGGAEFDAALATREQLLRLIRSYVSLYPGGARTAAAARIELETLFEIGTLRGGDWSALRARLAMHRNAASYAAAADEIDWWTALLFALDASASADSIFVPSTQPTTTLAPTVSEISPAASRPSGRSGNSAHEGGISAFASGFVRRNPQSRHAPAILRRLFDESERAGDRDEMQRIADLAAQRGAEDNTAALLAGRLARIKAVGQPFELTFSTDGQDRFSTAAWIGKPVLVLVWDSRAESSLRLMREIEAARRGAPDLEAVGVNLDADPREMQAAARSAQVSWPQFNDGHGRANAFARAWGVERAPLVFVIDRQGRLVGATSFGAWKAWLPARP